MKLAPFKQQIAKPVPLGPEHNPWFWNPSRGQFRKADSFFVERLHKEFGEELEITWNPTLERWQVWTKQERMNHPICRGWRLLFIHNDPEGNYLPLDERLFARLAYASVLHHGSAKAYFDRIMRERERDDEKKEVRLKQEAIDLAMPYWEHSQIKVAMRGKSSGSKFSTYHA